MRGELDTRHFEATSRFEQKEAVGTADLEQPSSLAAAAEQLVHDPAEVPAEDALAGSVACVAVARVALEIGGVVDGARVEARGHVRGTQPA
jgi:hypothetical protein